MYEVFFQKFNCSKTKREKTVFFKKIGNVRYGNSARNNLNEFSDFISQQFLMLLIVNFYIRFFNDVQGLDVQHEQEEHEQLEREQHVQLVLQNENQNCVRVRFI